MDPTLKSRILPGQVYRRQELEAFSSNLNQELQALIRAGALKRAYRGIYYLPKQSRFGELPPEDHDLIRAFLKTDDFLVFWPSLVNGLALGSTQLSNWMRVYNRKRHGVFKLDGRTFEFRRRLHFPQKLSAEFLFVEFLNERPSMAEEVPLCPQRLQAKIRELDLPLLKQIIKQFGKSYTQKVFADLI